jgi:hypothetical protein
LSASGHHQPRPSLAAIFLSKADGIFYPRDGINWEWIVPAIGAEHTEGRYEHIRSQLPLFGVASDPTLISAENSSQYSPHRGHESEKSSRIIQPVLIVFIGFNALCAGFWLMYFRARPGGLRYWLWGATVFSMGTVTCVSGEIWFLVLHTEDVSTGAAPLLSGESASQGLRKDTKAAWLGRFPSHIDWPILFEQCVSLPGLITRATKTIIAPRLGQPCGISR